MEKIIKDITKNRPNYCHVLEVNSSYELIDVVETLTQELEAECYTKNEIKEFVETLQIYSLSEDEIEAEKIYNVCLSDIVDNCL